MTWCFPTGARTAAAISLEAQCKYSWTGKGGRIATPAIQQKSCLKGKFSNTPHGLQFFPPAFAQFSTSFAMISLELQKCTLNPICTFCYITMAHSNDSCSVFWTSQTQNVQYRISSFPCPSPSCLFTKNFHFLSDTDTSSGGHLTLVLQSLSTHTWITAPQGI